MKFNLNRGLGRKDEKPAEAVPVVNAAGGSDIGETAAAISLALSLYMQEIHDYEKTVLTMQKVMRPYSPWSSKIYGLRERPMHIPRSRR